MAKKKSNNNGEKKNDDQQKKNDDGGKKDSNNTVVLKVDFDCEGCIVKVIKCIRSFEGVESVKRGDGDANKLTVIGIVDPVKLQEKVQRKTKKNVEVVSPLAKKDKNSDKEKDKDKDSAGGEKKKKTEDKPDAKKSKEPPVTTAVLKMNLHCEGCIQKIRKIIRNTKGYQEMNVDEQKDLVMVKGSMDMKALAESLKEKLKKPVEIVPPKKEAGGDKKEKGGGGQQGKGGGDGNAAGGGHGGGKAEGNKMEYVPSGYPFPYPNPYPYSYPNPNPNPNPNPYSYPYPYPYPNMYAPGYAVDHVHAPQMFSDENPNACSVM